MTASGEVRHLRGRVAGFESSRWWRLHPGAIFGRLRRSDASDDAPRATADHGPRLPVDFDETDTELCGASVPTR